MFKKIFSLFLILLLLNITLCPVFSAEDIEKVYENGVVNTEFVTDLNVNEASKKQIVQFISTEDYTDKTGFFIPKGTIFTGRIQKFKKSRWAYRRAKVRIIINEMRYPNGESYKIKAYTKRHVLKGSAAGNIAKGIITAPIAVVVLATGAVVMIVESVTVVGLLLVVPTGTLIGGITGKLTNGVNCKKYSGDSIKLKLIKTKSIPIIQLDSNDTIQNNNEQNEVTD